MEISSWPGSSLAILFRLVIEITCTYRIGDKLRKIFLHAGLERVASGCSPLRLNYMRSM